MWTPGVHWSAILAELATPGLMRDPVSRRVVPEKYLRLFSGFHMQRRQEKRRRENMGRGKRKKKEEEERRRAMGKRYASYLAARQTEAEKGPSGGCQEVA